MNILKIKQLSSGYLINDGESFAPFNSSLELEIQEWIAAGGIVEPEFTESELLQKVKDSKIQEINKQRDVNLNKNVSQTINGAIYQFQRSITSQLAWVNAVESMEDIALENWVTADNQIISLSKQDLISICCHIRFRDTTEVTQARKRKDAVNALSSIEEVESYDITQIYD